MEQTQQQSLAKVGSAFNASTPEQQAALDKVYSSFKPTDTTSPTILSSNTGKQTNKDNLQSLSSLEQTLAPMPLTPEEQDNYFSSQSSSDKPLSPTQFKEQLTVQGTSPAVTSMVNTINNDLSQGAINSSDATTLKESEANLLAAMAEARNLEDDPLGLNASIKRIEEFRTKYETDVADLFRNRDTLRAERERLMNPGTRETELRTQLNDLRNVAQESALQLEEDKFGEFEGQTLDFAQGRAAEFDVKDSFKRRELALKEQNLLLELGLEQELRDMKLKSTDQQVDDFESDFELRRAVEEQLFSLEEQVLQKADALKGDARDTLSSFIDALSGVDPTTLSQEALTQMKRLADTTGVPFDLVMEALKVAHQRQVFDDAIAQAKVTGNDGNDPTPDDEKPLTLNQIEQFRRSYGWTPPLGYTNAQLMQYIADNPTATPEELEAGAKQVAQEAGNSVPSWFKDLLENSLRQSLLPTFVEEKWQAAKAEGYSDEEIIDFLKNGS